VDDETEYTVTDLATRLTYLEAFSIACFIMLKEKLRRQGEDEARFGSEFHSVFREAMRFLQTEEGGEEDEDWQDSLDHLIRHVERGEDQGVSRRS